MKNIYTRYNRGNDQLQVVTSAVAIRTILTGYVYNCRVRFLTIILLLRISGLWYPYCLSSSSRPHGRPHSSGSWPTWMIRCRGSCDDSENARYKVYGSHPHRSIHFRVIFQNRQQQQHDDGGCGCGHADNRSKKKQRDSHSPQIFFCFSEYNRYFCNL